MSHPRVLISGLGVVAPPPRDEQLALPAADPGAAALWARLLAEASSLGPAPAREGLEVSPACVFQEDFPAERFVPPRRVRKAANISRMAVVAARQCLEDGVFAPDADLRNTTSVVLGTAFGCSAYYLRFHEKMQRGEGANAVLFTESVFNAAAGHVSMAHELHGASLVVAGGEEAGLSAVLAAADRIRVGNTQAALTGGVEEYSDLVHASLLAAGLVGSDLGGLASEAPGALAEGAALLLLEEASLARQRQALVYAELLGGARARPARNALALERAVRSACTQAGVELEAIDAVVAGGSGGPRTAQELKTLAELFPPGGRSRWLIAPQVLLGEGFAFTSAALVAVGARALAVSVVPPTPSGAPDSWSSSLEVAEATTPATLERVLVLTTTRSGSAVAVVLGRAPQDLARAFG